MSTVGDEGRQLTAALVGGRRFREKCLARYLEMSGVRVTIGVVEELRESLLSRGTTIDLVIFDTGYHTCNEPTIGSILACVKGDFAGHTNSR